MQIPGLRRRVKRGAALLDRKSPGWEREVCIGNLALDFCSRCTLGQLYGHYELGGSALFGEGAVACELLWHGFTLGHGDQRYWKKLSRMWRFEVIARRERAAALEREPVVSV